MSATPNFANTPNLGTNLVNARAVSTANTNRDGTGTIEDLVMGGANGTRIDRVNVKATSTTAAGYIVFYIKDGASNYAVIHEMVVTAVGTVDATHASFEDEWVRTDGQPVVELPSGWKLGVSTTIAQGFHVTPVVSGDF